MSDNITYVCTMKLGSKRLGQPTGRYELRDNGMAYQLFTDCINYDQYGVEVSREPMGSAIGLSFGSPADTVAFLREMGHGVDTVSGVSLDEQKRPSAFTKGLQYVARTLRLKGKAWGE